MLKQRVITGVILAAAFLAALVFLPVPLFSAFAALVVLIGAWEWANLAGFVQRWARGLYVAIAAGALVALALRFEFVSLGAVPFEASREEDIQWILMMGCIWWAVALLWVQSYPNSALLWGQPFTRAIMGLLTLIPAWVALSYVRALDQGVWLILLAVAIVAFADIGGYFAGRRWGKRKLAPKVSPGKTWEGFAGGLVANLILALLVALVSGASLPLLLVLVLSTSLVSVLGDLVESMMKRHRGVKDSSALLPGHGGILDRVDSLTAAAPVYALVLLVAGGTLG
ncbi:phosphatidate cytidylyltransferase [Marinimicrobium alkaliphilum]|uniref:phosphatidate cytidylyltransferase n=1 Tax=Marinimicrobium alkaliphilum TaxID=2202654 RepID=UPI000DBACF7F|nr:phosphatidate cytidylyltransferase [Marinimicrobium alkaliphilum]